MRCVPGDAPLARHLAVATAVLLPLAAWWLSAFPDTPAHLTQPCLLRAATGVPCSTCGGTRALLALTSGEPMLALAANPLVALSTVALAVWALGGVIATVAPRCRRRIEASPGEGRRLAIAACVLVAANWCWLVIRSS